MNATDTGHDFLHLVQYWAAIWRPCVESLEKDLAKAASQSRLDDVMGTDSMKTCRWSD